uniref:Dedicator of cytokinesis 3 n=1 Tax=Scleropages formosus TaxID=113540 RepID=A0A8C9TCB0_SCLFO
SLKYLPCFHTKFPGQLLYFRDAVFHGLTLEIGETVQILEKTEGETQPSGIFPASYIHLKKAIVTNRGPNETVVPLEDPIVTEVTTTLQEWAVLWKQLYVKHKTDLFFKLRHVMNELIDLRRQLLSGHLTQDQVREVKRHTTIRLDWGNEHLGLDLVPRQEFVMVDEDQISVSDLYKMVGRRGTIFTVISKPTTAAYMICDKNTNSVPRIQLALIFCFRLFSERFMVRLNKSGGPKNLEKADRLCTLFMVMHISNACVHSYCLYKRTLRNYIRILLHFFESVSIRHSFYLFAWQGTPQMSPCLFPKFPAGLIISLQFLHGDTEQIRREHPGLFTRGISVTRQLGFPEVVIPGDVRNDLYLTLERGEFEKGGKSVQKNIEITMYVLYADGQILKDCMSLGAGEPSASEYHSLVFYHNNAPRWSEMVKLSIPLDRFRGSHLRFELRHCSTKDRGEKKLFGFAFTPLMREDGTTLADESHELYVYKCDENTTFSNHALYLGLPCCKEDLSACPGSTASPTFQRSPKELLWVSTQLCSSKLTQNGIDVLALLNWKSHPDRVMDILGRLRYIGGEEIVKFLQNILDTLFSILEDNTDKYGPLVFQSLVFVINLLREGRFSHFRSITDTYIHNHFSGALAYKELIRCLKWYMERSAEVTRQDHIQEAMRALDYLFKFIVQSRTLYSQATCGMEEDQFRASIQELFQSIRFVLSLDSRSSENLIFTQVALLSSLPAVFDELLPVFTVQEAAELVRGTLSSMPSTVHMGQSMDVVKLQSIAGTVDSRLFSFAESRRVLLPVVLHHIHLHLRQQRELLICSGILSSIFSLIKASSLFSCFSYPYWQGEYVSCLLSLLSQMSDVHFQHLLDNFQSQDELKEFLLRIFCMFRNLMKLSVFPRDWAVLRLLTSHIILKTTQQLSLALRKNFSGATFDFKVWSSYFSLAVLYISQPSLQLEALSPAKRNKVLDKYGDMRVTMAYDLYNMWQNLGEDKVHFIPGTIGAFLGVTLVPQDEVRNIMIPILHDMMDWEQRRSGSFKQVEAELADKLDTLVSEGKGDESHRKLINLLAQLFGPYPSLLERIEQETWREMSSSFVTSVMRLTELVSMSCFELYIRYIHKLCNAHLKTESYAEAGFTLLLYWELLQWEPRPLREFLHYPAQSEWQRKEALSRKVIHYFNKGKAWEYGIPVCRELAAQYEASYDYQSLSWIRKLEATYYDNILEQPRLEPEFFRVGFYGKKFPFFLRNKEFVCRGHDYERLEAFQQRMLGEFPEAIAMQHASQPDDSILQYDGQYLQIYAVTPVTENADVLQMDHVSDRIKSFYRVNNVRRFRFDRPFHKGMKDRENEIKSLWIERTTLTLSHPLPSISRWAQVEKRELVEVSPVENAISVVENKNQELRMLIGQYQHRPPHSNVNQLSMCLNGVIDAAVNGGVARYQEAFFDEDYIESHPQDVQRISKLRAAMQEQVHILGAGLAVHERLVHPDMRPLHKKLVDQFYMMRSGFCRVSFFAVQNILSSRRVLFKFFFFVFPHHLVMQLSPSSSSLSSTHSAPSQMINSAHSSGRGESWRLGSRVLLHTFASLSVGTMI